MSAYKELKFTITGISPLLMHNGQLADPLSQSSRSISEITSKRKKTEADHAELGRREWYGSLYLMNKEPCLPAEALEAVIVAGAKKERAGPAAKAGVIVEANAPLEYPGPRAIDQLWADEAYRLRVAAKVTTSKIMRTRPIFREWSATIAVKYLPSMANASQVRGWLERAGGEVGLLDWRPRFGRFAVS